MALFSSGVSHATLRNASVLSGNQPGHFAIYFAGPRGATAANPVFSAGNTLDNVVVGDQICDDGVSWSFQTDGTVNNVRETGSRLALYIDNGTTVNNYQYTPGPCRPVDNGYWITPPSCNITINGFASSERQGKSVLILHRAVNVPISQSKEKRLLRGHSRLVMSQI